MTTLEEVFLHLEGEGEDSGGPVDGLSRKLVRARALSRSLSLQSKSPSYQELQDKDNSSNHTLQSDIHFNHVSSATPSGQNVHATGVALHTTGHGIEHVKVFFFNLINIIQKSLIYNSTRIFKVTSSAGNSSNPPPDLSQLADYIKVRPNTMQILGALIWIRTIRMIRDPYKLYMLIILPIGNFQYLTYIKNFAFILSSVNQFDIFLQFSPHSVYILNLVKCHF